MLRSDKRERDQRAKGKITKEYFPVVADRLNMRINITHNFTPMVTRHGNIRSYLHRFKIIETPTCPCGTKGLTIDHLLFECELLNKDIQLCITSLWWTALKEQYLGKDAVGRPGLQYLKQVARNRAADSYTAVERMACDSCRWKAAKKSKDWALRRRLIRKPKNFLYTVF